MSKLTLIIVPGNIGDSELVVIIILLSEMINDGESFEVIEVMSQSSETREYSLKNFAIKCYPKTHYHILNIFQGYVYIDLKRCKVYNRFFFFVLQWCHWRAFNNFENNCPNLRNTLVRGKCARNHDTKVCSVLLPKFINCVKSITL